MLVEGCLSVLSDRNFTRRFEVYATLNCIVRANPTSTLIELFVGDKADDLLQKPLLIVKHIINDIEIEEKIFDTELNKENESPTKGDPFKIRIVTQALKLLNSFVSNPELNTFITIEDISWIYEHASEMLVNPNISKAVVSPYLSIIKDCKLSPTCRKELFSNHAILEKMLFGVLNVNSFPSSSLVTERFTCLKNYIVNFPDFMASNISYWFEPLILNLCNMIHPVYMKCLGVGVHCLLEAAKCFLNSLPVHSFVLNQLSSPVTNKAKSFTSDPEFSKNLNRLQSVRLSEFVVCKLEELIHVDHKLAMDMWMALTLLVGAEQFDKWTDINLWLNVPSYCFSLGPEATALSLFCWRAVCFNLCKNGLVGFRKAIDCIRSPRGGDQNRVDINTLKSKVTILTLAFNNLPTGGLSKEVSNSIYNTFLTYIFAILGPDILKLWTKYLPILWDKVIQPIFHNLYLKQEVGSYTNQLAFELLTSLLRNSAPHPEAEFNEVRILSNEPIKLDQINPLPARFVHIHFDKVMESVILLFQLDSIKFEQKMSLFISFLNKVKLIVKKEQNISPTTYDFIDNLPLLLKKLLKNQSVSSEALLRILVTMHDTFNPSLLINHDLERPGFDSNINVYMPIVESTNSLPVEGKGPVFRLILQSLTHTKALVLITDILKTPLTSNDILQILTEFLNKSNIVLNPTDLKLYRIICKHIKINFEVFVKKVIQSIVAIPNSSEICKSLSALHIDEWEAHVCDYVLLLLRNAPSKSIHHFVAGVISRRLETSLVQTLAFVTKNDFASELFLLSGSLFDFIVKLEKPALFECCQLLDWYLRFKSQQGGNDFLLIDILGSGCNKYLHMDITFLQELVDFSQLPLCSHQIAQEENTNNEDNKKPESVELILKKENSAQVTPTSENLIDRCDKMSLELSNGEQATEITLTSQEQMDVIPQSRMEDTPHTAQLTATEIVKHLSDISDQELSTLGPHQKYEIESNLLKFMIKLRQLQ